MTCGRSLAIRVAVAATGTGVGGVTAFSAGRSCDHSVIAMTQLVLHDRTADGTGLISRTGSGRAGGMTCGRDFGLGCKNFTANGAVLALGQPLFGTGGSLGGVNDLCVSLGGDNTLINQHFLTHFTVSSCRQSGFGTGGRLRSKVLSFMSLGRNYFLRLNGFTTFPAMRSFGQAEIDTCGLHSLIDHNSMDMYIGGKRLIGIGLFQIFHLIQKRIAFRANIIIQSICFRGAFFDYIVRTYDRDVKARLQSLPLNGNCLFSRCATVITGNGITFVHSVFTTVRKLQSRKIQAFIRIIHRLIRGTGYFNRCRHRYAVACRR